MCKKTKIRPDDFWEETIHCWECPICGEISVLHEEPNYMETDLFICDHCKSEIELDKELI